MLQSRYDGTSQNKKSANIVVVVIVVALIVGIVVFIFASFIIHTNE